MKRSSNIAITAAVLIGMLPVLILVGTEVILNTTGVKSKIENTVSNALAMVFKIEGRIDIGLFPLSSLAANNITVKLKSSPIASADQIAIDPRLQPLLNRNIQIKDARIHRARLALDPLGCITDKEVVEGSFANPKFRETEIIQRTVIRPLKRFLKTECEAFYNGSVQHPPGAPT